MAAELLSVLSLSMMHFIAFEHYSSSPAETNVLLSIALKSRVRALDAMHMQVHSECNFLFIVSYHLLNFSRVSLCLSVFSSTAVGTSSGWCSRITELICSCVAAEHTVPSVCTSTGAADPRWEHDDRFRIGTSARSQPLL